MVLTGKQALDYSGGVSAEDNLGIGGYERVMGPNGQAQYWARGHRRRLPDPAAPLRAHLRGARRALPSPGCPPPIRATATSGASPAHAARSFATVGEMFSDETNPGRKKPFDIRTVMGAAIDQDHPPLERWAGIRDAESAVVWDAHVGGWPVCLLGLESRPAPAAGLRPRRRARPLDLGHAVPALLEEGGPGRSTPPAAIARWSCWPTSRASTARRSRCASCSSSTAPRSAGRW